MKKRLQGILIGIVVGAMLTGGLAHAKELSEKAEIFYRNIKIYVDGGEIIPKGSDGSVVEPFIMNGATYLPVRALAEALGQDVAWDGKTSSVYIGKTDALQPDNYLNKIQHNMYQESDSDHDYTIINGTVTDCQNTTYNGGLLFYIDGYADNFEDGSAIRVGYPLNGQYRKLTGKIVIPKEYNMTAWSQDKDNLDRAPANVWIYGDGELLHQSVYVVDSMAFSFDIDVRGVNELEIRVASSNGYCNYIALTDLALFK